MTLTLSDRIAALGGAVTGRAIVRGGFAWLTPELLATAPAQERTRRYGRAGCPAPDRDALCVVGAERVFDVLRAALDRLPDCVADHIVRNTITAAVGRRTNGWITSVPHLPNPTETPFLVVLNAVNDAADLAGVAAHEWAHAYLGALVPAGSILPTPQQQRDEAARLDRIAVEWGVRDPRPLRHARAEYYVARLTASWGFVGPGADVERYEHDLRAARRAIERG